MARRREGLLGKKAKTKEVALKRQGMVARLHESIRGTKTGIRTRTNTVLEDHCEGVFGGRDR